jgi:hypothetical protein
LVDGPISINSNTITVSGDLTVTNNFNAKTVTTTGSITSGGNLLGGAGFVIGFTGRGRFKAASDGVWQLLNSGESAMSTLQLNRPNLTKTVNYTITALDSGSVISNIGAVVTNRYDLPTATVGLEYCFVVDAAFNVQIQATGNAVIHDGAVASAANGDIHSNIPYSTIQIRSHKSGHWIIGYKSSGWTGPQ